MFTMTGCSYAHAICYFAKASVFPSSICVMITKNMLIIHHSCVYIMYELKIISITFPIVFLKKYSVGTTLPRLMQIPTTSTVFPLSTIINVTSGSLVCGLNISQPTVSVYHTYLVTTTFLPHV